jgi:predicted Zn-dependent peptidase
MLTGPQPGIGPVKLRNGVILITEPIVTVKTAAIGFWFYTGSRAENDANRGVTHFTEHMLFKGTTSRSTFDIACAFDRIGGYINAYTEREDVCVYCVVPSLKVKEALDILCDMASNAAFDEKELERERKVVESEIITSEDDPEDSALDAVENAVWPHQKISASISGSVEQVRRLDRQTVASWYDKYFIHGRMCVCAAGCFDKKALEERISQLPSHIELPLDRADKELAGQYADQIPVWKSGVSFIKSSFQQEQFFLLYPLRFPVDERAYYTLAVMNALTGDTMSSRLFQTLREKGGWCYSVYSYSTFYADTACWCAYASSGRLSSRRILEGLYKEIKYLFDYGVSETEVESAREHLCGEELMADADMENRMKFLERCYDSGYGYKSTDERIALIRSVTKDDIERCLHEMFDVKNKALIVYGPGLSLKEKKDIIALYGN